MITELADKSEKAAAKATDVKQKGQWAVNEATKTLEEADSVIAKLNEKIDTNEGDQGPVFEGIQELGKATDDAKKAAEPIVTKKEDMAGGAGDGSGAGDMVDDMNKLETKLKELKAATTKVTMGTEELVSKKERVAKAAEKASEFGIPWAPPPETPFGAPGEGRVE